MKAILEMHPLPANFVPSPALNLASVARPVFKMAMALCLTLLAPSSAIAQSASFAFGQGGFDLPADGHDGVFNECAGSVEGYGTSACDGVTHKYGGYGHTYVEQQTEVVDGYGYRPNGSLARAAASFDRYGYGASAATCRLSRNHGMTNCASGAYGSVKGATAKLSLSSAR